MASKTLIARFSEIEKKIREHEAAAEDLKPARDLLKAQLLEQMQRDGITKASCSGVTIYIHRQWWASRAGDADTGAACDGLRAAGLGEYVKEGFNTQALSAYIREMRKMEAGRYPDDALAGEEAAQAWTEGFIRQTGNTIKVSEKLDLRAKKS